jgi:hypothetical protein
MYDCDVFMRRASWACDRPRCRPRLNQCPSEIELLTKGVISFPVVGVLAPAAMESADLRHGSNSLALCSARSISPVGVS